MIKFLKYVVVSLAHVNMIRVFKNFNRSFLVLFNLDLVTGLQVQPPSL